MRSETVADLAVRALWSAAALASPSKPASIQGAHGRATIHAHLVRATQKNDRKFKIAGGWLMQNR